MCNPVMGGDFQIDFSTVLDREPINVLNNNEYLYSTGRGAIFEILNSIKKNNNLIDTILLPDYLCDSISNTVIDFNLNIEFYHIDSCMMPDRFDLFDKLRKNKILFVINYFGLINLDSLISEIKLKMNIPIIYDKVQDLFSIRKTTKADYVFTSFRKWLPVIDGALVITNEEMNMDSPCDKDFLLYKLSGSLLKQYSNSLEIDDSIFLSFFEEGENLLDKDYKGICSKFSKNILSSFDFNDVKVKRLENYTFLKNHLSNKVKYINNTCESVPMFFPIIIENRDVVRKALFKNNMFCPVHWPKANIVENEQLLYDNELSLIIDQRYNLDDMKRMVEVIEDCL